MTDLKITAKELVEFLYAGGDLSNDFRLNAQAIDGQVAHSYLQDKYKETDFKEVSIETVFDMDQYHFHITGRMDGLLIEQNRQIIEEIKSTKVDLDFIEIDSRPQHLAQAKMYAYIFCFSNQIKSIRVRLTYINIDTYETKSFEKRYNMTQLTSFFEQTIKEYIAWLNIITSHQERKLKTIQGLGFPFAEYRDGQRELMSAVYKTILKRDILYAIAPTGIGKTIATIYSALKTIETDTQKIFYLTAKNQGKMVALETISLLHQKGLVLKVVELANKDKMCLMKEKDCDPLKCPYAKGFFNRLNDGTRDIFLEHQLFTHELVKEYGAKHKLCPHEFSLYLSYFSDIVIGDYNYAFDPRVHLIRYFEESNYQPILLIDEAHNLIQRSRDMYSASLSKSTILSLRRKTSKYKPSARHRINKLVAYFDELSVRYELQKKPFRYDSNVDDTLLQLIDSVCKKVDNIIAENEKIPNKTSMLDDYFELYQFLRIHEYFNESFIVTLEQTNEDMVVSIRCLDASKYLLETIQTKTFGTSFFSATLFPLDYHMKLLTQGVGEYIELNSPFPAKHLNLMIKSDISTRYKDRDQSLDEIIELIDVLISGKIGNYIVFFPSYVYLEKVKSLLDFEDVKLYVQTSNMSQYEKMRLILDFEQTDTMTKLGLFVMGGSFAEGIDLIGEKLSGVMIIGVAIPQMNEYNNILRSYFDETLGNGFDYAYTYPGINKVIQAVGRLIRTHDDKGIAILVDDRFMQGKYIQLFPHAWRHFKKINNVNLVRKEIAKFFKKG